MPPLKHWFLGASNAKRYLTCTPGARLGERMTKLLGDRSSPFAEEGTKAHELAEIKVRNAVYHADKMTAAKFAKLSPEQKETYVGINDFRYKELRKALGDIPDDMEHATDSYCDILIEKYLTAKDHDPGAKILLETRLDFSEWVPGGFGTGDAIIVSDSLLEICDYKHGMGIRVEAEENPQIRLYALGAVHLFSTMYDFTSVRGTIIQPRLNNLSEETIGLNDLLDWAENYVKPRAEMAYRGEGEFVPGEHCRFCPAKAVCSARVSKALEMFTYGFENPGTIDDEQIPGILETLDIAEDWIKDIRSYAETRALNGTKFRGYKLVRGKKPNRKWADTEEVEAQLLRAGYPTDLFRVTSLKSVGDIEKALGKKAFDALVGGLVAQGEAKLILVPESDKRQEYSSADVDFKDLNSL